MYLWIVESYVPLRFYFTFIYLQKSIDSNSLYIMACKAVFHSANIRINYVLDGSRKVTYHVVGSVHSNTSDNYHHRPEMFNSVVLTALHAIIYSELESMDFCK
jgi:hypothetical protein